jgi:hypothetical protein
LRSPAIGVVQFWLALWLGVSAISLVGLLAVWAARAPRHWFLRTAAVGGVLCLLAVVPAFELILIFAAEEATVAMPFAGWRVRRQGRFHFCVADLLLVTVVVATGALIAKEMPSYLHYVGNLLCGVVCGCVVLWGWGIATLRKRKWMEVISLVGLPIGAIAILRLSGLYLWDAPQWSGFLALPMVAAVVCGCLVQYRAASSPKGSRRFAARMSLVLLFAALLPLPAVAYYQMAFPTPIPPSALPARNAYVELTRIGEELNTNEPVDCTPQLRAAHDALADDSLVPVSYQPMAVHLAPHAELRALLRVWNRAGRAAEADGRYDDACDTYLDLILASAKIRRGGLLIDWLLSGPFLKDGLDGLQRVRGRLAASKLRQACVQLRSCEAALEPVEKAFRRDEICAQHVFGWQARIRFLPILEFDRSALKRMEIQRAAELRLLECDLAVRRFQQEHGKPPERLAQLAPDLLPTVPLDPYGGPWVYRRRHDGFFLYSVGPDQVDNGGVRPASEQPSAGEDLLLLSDRLPDE